MQSHDNFLSSLYRRGVRLWVKDGQLHFHAPTGTLQREELQELRRLKTEIVKLLEEVDFTEDLPLRPRGTNCLAPLTPLQAYVWCHMEKQGTFQSERFCNVSVRLTGRLNVPMLGACIDVLVRRHESLRTRFLRVNDVPTQHIDSPTNGTLQISDLSGTRQQNIERELQERAELFVREKVDVAVGPLFAAKLFRVSDLDHVLILAIEHLVSDGVSLEIIDRELWTAYEKMLKQQPIELPDLPIQFADYAVWQERTYDTWKKRHEGYWSGRLNGVPSLKIPRDLNSVEVANPISEARHFSFGQPLSFQLHEIARREMTMPALVVLTIFLAVMSRWLNETDLTVMFVSNGRYRPELRNIIGCLADILYLRVKAKRANTFIELLHQLIQEFHSANAHPGFGRVPALIPAGITELHFNWQPYSWIPWLAGDHKEVAGLKIEHFDLKKVFPATFAPFFFETKAGIGGTVLHRPDLISTATIEWFFGELRHFAKEWMLRSSARIA